MNLQLINGEIEDVCFETVRHYIFSHNWPLGVNVAQFYLNIATKSSNKTPANWFGAQVCGSSCFFEVLKINFLTPISIVTPNNDYLFHVTIFSAYILLWISFLCTTLVYHSRTSISVSCHLLD